MDEYMIYCVMKYKLEYCMNIGIYVQFIVSARDWTINLFGSSCTYETKFKSKCAIE
jgi:hypothetical protein